MNDQIITEDEMEETTTKARRPKRSDEQRRADLEAELAALARKADEARLRATAHGKRLLRVRTDLSVLFELFDEDGVREHIEVAQDAIEAAIEKCLAVVRGVERGGGRA